MPNEPKMTTTFVQVQTGPAEKGQQGQAQGDGAEGGEDVVQDRDA